MLSKLRDALISHGWAKRNSITGIGVSGGRDSVALLHALSRLSKELGFSIVCLHFEHGIRGEASLADADFVRELAKKLDVPFYISRADVPALALGTNLEAAARDARYAFFSDMTQRLGLAHIATAHHAGDQAETVLLNLLRGCGTDGLCGMASERKPNIIRPLLGVSRAEIERYISENELSYRDDVTNECTDYSRNYIRHVVLPSLEKLTDTPAATIARAAALVREDKLALDAVAAREYTACARFENDELIIDASTLDELPRALQSRIIRHGISEHFILKDIEKTHIDAVLDVAFGSTGRRVSIKNGLIALNSYGKLIISQKSYRIEKGAIIPLQLGMNILWDGYALSVAPADTLPEHFPPTASLLQFADASALDNAFIRTRRTGDRITVFGGGTKKLKDLFIDAKTPRELRDTLPLIARNDRILWVPGYAMSESLRTKDGARAFTIELRRI